METYLWWAIAGIALIVAELVTGTFYLLVIGIAALAAAASSQLGHAFATQAVVATAVAVVGVVVVTHYRAKQSAAPSGAAALDVGQSVVLDSWINEQDRLARVRYRDALWEAKVTGSGALDAGRILYIQRVDGNTLHVSATRPA